ncbi:MAG: ATP-dependent DNA ligase [Thermoplasmata archaeon]
MSPVEGPETPLLKLVELSGSLEGTSSRLEKRRLLVQFLKTLLPEEVSPAVLLLTGRILPESERRALNVGWATISKAMDSASQVTLVSEHLTILQVYRAFQEISRIRGKDSVRKKRRLLQALFAQASEEEKDILVRSLFGEMRIGVNEGVILEVLADASGADLELVRRANMFSGDLGRTAYLTLTEGTAGLQRQGLRLFTPIKPMMAEIADGLEEVFVVHSRGTALEYKLDGARIQMHRKGGRVRIYTRRLTEVTDSLPEVVALAGDFAGGDLLVEGEVVAVDETDRPLPFQDLMRRFRRVHDVEALAARIPLRLYLFDALMMDGKPLIDLPYEDRWEALAKAVDRTLLVPRLLRPTVEEGATFLEEALEEGHEGLMAKDPGSLYTPGKRGKRWLKVKPVESLDVAIIAAEWGHGRRQGWLSNYHLGVRDEEGNFHMIGKTFKGLTDEEFEEMTRRLLRLKTKESPYVVYVRPQVVVEVAYNEIQRSPHYDSGFALRFARITRIRDDLSPEDADTIERLEALYAKQFERKGRLADS